MVKSGKIKADNILVDMLENEGLFYSEYLKAMEIINKAEDGKDVMYYLSLVNP